MTNEEYKNTIIGTLVYGTSGIVAGLLGWTTIMIILGIFAIARSWAVLWGPFVKKDEDEQNKG